MVDLRVIIGDSKDILTGSCNDFQENAFKVVGDLEAQEKAAQLAAMASWMLSQVVQRASNFEH